MAQFKRRNLGQHFLNDQQIAKKIVECAEINSDDVICELGTGKGILTKELAKKAKLIHSYEIDKELYLNSLSISKLFQNIIMINSDFFQKPPLFYFDTFISNIPYSKSKKIIQWLLVNDFKRAVIMCQKEFVNKLLAGNEKFRAISVLTQYKFEIIPLFDVKRNSFTPPPLVDSTVIKLIPKPNKSVNPVMIRRINLILSYKNKTITNIIKFLNLDKKEISKYFDTNKKLKDLSLDEIIKLSKTLDISSF